MNVILYSEVKVRNLNDFKILIFKSSPMAKETLKNVYLFCIYDLKSSFSYYPDACAS